MGSHFVWVQLINMAMLVGGRVVVSGQSQRGWVGQVEATSRDRFNGNDWFMRHARRVQSGARQSAHYTQSWWVKLVLNPPVWVRICGAIEIISSPACPPPFLQQSSFVRYGLQCCHDSIMSDIVGVILAAAIAKSLHSQRFFSMQFQQQLKGIFVIFQKKKLIECGCEVDQAIIAINQKPQKQPR